MDASKGQLVFSSSLFAGKFMSLQVCNIVDPPEANAPVHLWFRPKPIQYSLDSFVLTSAVRMHVFPVFIYSLIFCHLRN